MQGGMDARIILSSGLPANLQGPNNGESTTHLFGEPGDTDLDSLIPGFSTNDACIIQFDFICPPETASFTPQVNFNYVFASEEYDEYVDDQFNDVFGFFLNGVNIATIPNTNPPVPVSINTVYVEDNSQFFVENDGDVGFPYNHEADGHTTVLTAVANPEQGVNTIKLAIADAGDSSYDSWVLLEAGSFSCVPQIIETPNPTYFPTDSPSKSPTVSKYVMTCIDCSA